jgi:hypothetical protein
MARVHHVKKSQKEQGPCQKCGIPIEKGVPYKWVAIMTGQRSSRTMKRCDACRTWRPSELTTSKMAGVYAAQESVDDVRSEWNPLDDDTSALNDALCAAAESVREVADEYRESADNIEDGFGHPTFMSEELEQKADELGSWADEIEQSATDLPESADECPECRGIGTVPCEEDGGTKKCPDCDGESTLFDDFESAVDDVLSVMDNCPV